ncbi:putative phage tail protein [Nicoletella semolina]|uniref:Putative phage tail protein n=1 Tax=Nicoletella semolina TaxID=271160 RepID=A0A4R2N9G6_9PAST|nr:putative phage tail protein [Nicoletella semolina]
MATIIFHGNLKRFGTHFTLEAETFSELMSGLLTQINGLRQQLQQGYYKVRLGKNRYLSESQIKTNPALQLANNETIHLTPAASGAGRGFNFGQIIAGVALIGVSLWNPFVWSAAGATLGLSVGASLAISGTIGLLTKPPEMAKVEEGEKQQSTSFSNLRNLTPQGRPIPLLYGKMMTSLVLISQGIESFDDAVDVQKPMIDEQSNAQHQQQTRAREREEQERAREDNRDSRETREQERAEREERRRENERMYNELF